MNRQAQGWLALIVAPLVGAGAGFLTLLLGSLPLWLGPISLFIEGLPFGIAMAVYLRIGWNVTARTKLYLFMAVSCAAYLAAVFAAIYLPMFFGLSIHSGDRDPIPRGPMFMGGFIGSLILLTAVFLLFCRQRWFWVAGQVLFFAITGGLLGILGWNLTALGLPLWSLMAGGDPSYVSPDAPRYYSLYPVWQAGMALVLAAVLAGNAPVVAARPVTSSRGRVSVTTEDKLSLPAKLFAAAAILFLGWLAFRQFYGYLLQRQREAITQQSFKEAPSAEGLPEIESPPVDQALVLDVIEGYVAKPLPVQHAPGFKDASGRFPGRPQTVVFSVMYVDPARSLGTGVQPTAMVDVVQYPNAEWANYDLRNYPAPNDGVLYPKNVQKISKFGSQIYSNSGCRSDEKCFYWVSDKFRVSVRFSWMPEKDEFIRRYLVKYPPS